MIEVFLFGFIIDEFIYRRYKLKQEEKNLNNRTSPKIQVNQTEIIVSLNYQRRWVIVLNRNRSKSLFAKLIKRHVILECNNLGRTWVKKERASENPLCLCFILFWLKWGKYSTLLDPFNNLFEAWKTIWLLWHSMQRNVKKLICKLQIVIWIIRKIWM